MTKRITILEDTKLLGILTVSFTALVLIIFNIWATNVRYENSRRDYIDRYYGEDITFSQMRAIDSVEAYLHMSDISSARLIEIIPQSWGNDLTEDDVSFAIDYVEKKHKIDWNEKAYNKARYYTGLRYYTERELFDILHINEKFTIEQTKYAIEKLGI